MIGSAPLRFIALVVATYVGARSYILSTREADLAPQLAVATPPRPGLTMPERALPEHVRQIARIVAVETADARPIAWQRRLARQTETPRAPAPERMTATAHMKPASQPAKPGTVTMAGPNIAKPHRSAPASSQSPPPRWVGSAWLLVRSGGANALALPGQLGGSQAGARATYRIGNSPFALAARLSTPLRSLDGAEAAIGVEWRLAPSLNLLAERRQRLGNSGRNAFALLIYGGFSDRKIGPLAADGYAQAGMVGMKRRDPFADGTIGAGIPIGEQLRVGGGIWGAAQPGLSRLDAGPELVTRLPLGAVSLRAAASWRVRITGNASPASGPALAIGSDF